MAKLGSSKHYSELLKLLLSERQSKGITQSELARRLAQTQSFVSKIERGERRLDVTELRTICQALEISFTKITRKLDSILAEGR